MHGAAGGDVSHDEFGRCTGGDGDVAGNVGYVLADGGGVELTGGGALGIDGSSVRMVISEPTGMILPVPEAAAEGGMERVNTSEATSFTGNW